MVSRILRLQLCALLLGAGIFPLTPATTSAATMTFEEYLACKKKAFGALARSTDYCNRTYVNKMRARAACILATACARRASFGQRSFGVLSVMRKPSG